MVAVVVAKDDVGDLCEVYLEFLGVVEDGLPTRASVIISHVFQMTHQNTV